MKFPPGRYPREIYFLCHESPKNEHCPIRTSPLVKIPPLKIGLQQIKKSLKSVKSKIMQIKDSGICILQKSSTVYQNCFQSLGTSEHKTNFVRAIKRNG